MKSGGGGGGGVVEKYMVLLNSLVCLLFSSFFWLLVLPSVNALKLHLNFFVALLMCPATVSLFSMVFFASSLTPKNGGDTCVMKRLKKLVLPRELETCSLHFRSCTCGIDIFKPELSSVACMGDLWSPVEEISSPPTGTTCASETWSDAASSTMWLITDMSATVDQTKRK